MLCEQDALKFMNGHSLPGAKKGLLVKFAEDHHRRLQRQEQGQVMIVPRVLLHVRQRGISHRTVECVVSVVLGSDIPDSDRQLVRQYEYHADEMKGRPT